MSHKIPFSICTDVGCADSSVDACDTSQVKTKNLNLIQVYSIYYVYIVFQKVNFQHSRYSFDKVKVQNCCCRKI